MPRLEYTVEEIKERIKDTKTWNDSFEKELSLKSLYSMLRNRQDQSRYGKGIFVKDSGLHLPTLSERFWHFVFCKWVEFDDTNVFDCAKRICLICGATESTPMQRQYGYDYNGGKDTAFRDSILKKIKKCSTCP